MHAKLAGLVASFLMVADAGTPPPPAGPVETPTQAEARKVINYYYQGKDQGPVLVELKACLKLEPARDNLQRSDCLETVNGPVKKGTTVSAWTLWMVPEGGNYDDVFIQVSHEGLVRSTV